MDDVRAIHETPWGAEHSFVCCFCSKVGALRRRTASVPGTEAHRAHRRACRPASLLYPPFMRLACRTLAALIGLLGCAKPTSHETAPPARAVILEELTWNEAERRLTPESVVVIPLGAASKEHGPHLSLKNDWLLAEHFKRQVLAADVIIAPTVGFSYYPAFSEYPGSISLRLETARDLVIDICKSLAAHGPRRFYVLNTGVSTVRALVPAAEMLAQEGILLRHTDLGKALGPTEKEIGRQEGGSHADEIETSMMLAIAPETVDMKKAVKDYDASGQGGLTRRKGGTGTYSPTGIYGDPTLATRAKGEKLVAALTRAILDDIEALRRSPLPTTPR
ncbi:Creatinine amidohydrolase [Minicystis rosea]|nr:Creatinine amidohydrolase [Minicystis rosea]